MCWLLLVQLLCHGRMTMFEENLLDLRDISIISENLLAGVKTTYSLSQTSYLLFARCVLYRVQIY